MPSRMLLCCLLALALVGLAPVPGLAGEMGPRLRDLARSPAPAETVPVLIRLRGALDLGEFRDESDRAGEDRATRRARLVRSLQRRSRNASSALRRQLARQGVSRIRMLWVRNSLAAELPVWLLDRVAERPEVESVQLDAVVHPAEPGPASPAAAGWNLTLVGAPALWNEGHRGQGVVVAGMDSGVDAFHPDLGPRQRPVDSWFDPYGEHATPSDPTGHGTQSMGLILGGDAGGQAIGMAPDAQWIAVKLFNDAGVGVLSSMHQGYQWLLDPDGDPGTDDLPDVVNSSWTLNGVDQCDLEFQPDVDALRTAEVAVVFSAGNFGPSPSTSASPSNNEGALAVGAVDSLLAVASFSSRGPSACDAGIYPQLVAPGVNVLTADLTFGGLFPAPYLTVTGTSFAAPHVSGALALLRGAHPLASLAELENAVVMATQDLGVPGPDQDSGWGLLDVEAAHQLLAAAPVPSLSPLGLAITATLLLVAAGSVTPPWRRGGDGRPDSSGRADRRPA